MGDGMGPFTTHVGTAFVTYDPQSFESEEHLRQVRAQIRTHAVKVTRRSKAFAAPRHRRALTRAPTSASYRWVTEDEANNRYDRKKRSSTFDKILLVNSSMALHLKYEDHILPRFFAEQVDQPFEIGCPMWTEPFVQLLVESPDDSLVRQSLIAFAAEYDYRAQYYRLSEAAYQQAISTLRKVIQHKKSESMEAILCSVLLLAIWESIHALRNSTAPRLIHHTAGLELIRFYGNRVLETAIARHMASGLLTMHIWTYWLPLAPRLTDTKDFPNFLYAYTYRENQPLVDELAVMVAKLRYLARDVWNNNQAGEVISQERMAELMSAAESVNAKLNHWQQMLPSSYYPRAVTDIRSVDSSVRQAGMYKNLCDVYVSHEKAHRYNKWRTLKLYCLMTMALIKQNSVEPDIIDSIRYHLDRVCASIPFTIGNLGPSTSGEELAFPPVPTGPDNHAKFVNRHGDFVTYTRASHASEAQHSGDVYVLGGLSDVLPTLGWPDQSKMQEISHLLRRSPSDDIGDQIQWVVAQFYRVIMLRGKIPVKKNHRSIRY